MPPVPCPPRPSPPHVLGALVKKKNRSQKTFEAPPRGTSPPSGDEVQPLSERPHCCHLDCFPFSEKGPDLEPRLEHVFVSHGMVKEHVKKYRGGVCGMPGNRTEIRNDSMCALRGRSSALRKRSALPLGNETSYRENASEQLRPKYAQMSHCACCGVGTACPPLGPSGSFRRNVVVQRVSVTAPFQKKKDCKRTARYSGGVITIKHPPSEGSFPC